jgi:hypothetical protein
LATTLHPSRGRTEAPSRHDEEVQEDLTDDPLSGELSSSDERLQVVERIAGSEPFQKSSRLPALLRHLAVCTLRNARSGLTEQAIGRTVFGKPRDFNPAEDSSVRVYMRQLRLRLHEYYQNSGPDEKIVIEIPKGGYALAFHHRQSPALNLEQGTPEIPTGAGESEYKGFTSALRQINPWIPWVLMAASLLLAVAGWYRGSRVVNSNAPVWPISQVIQPGQQTTLVLADASYVLHLLGDREISLDEYADRHYSDRLIPKDASEGELRLFHYLQSSQITSMADARAAFEVSALAGSQRDHIALRSAKELNGNILSNGNFIFVGAPTSNPWVQLYQDRLNFHLVDRGTNGNRYIENHSPRPGEQHAYFITESTGHSGDDYATISMVPVRGQQGDALLLQGIRLEGTEAAIRFLSNSDSRNQIMEKLKSANNGTLPRYFEVLLHAHSVAGSPATIDCIAARPVLPSRD